jgi:hypothetical protein
MKRYQVVARELKVVERMAWCNPRVRRVLKAAPLVVMFLLLNSRAARAACSFSPSPDPTVDGSPNSLRHAIQAANGSGQNCTIQLQAGTYTLTIKNTNGQDNTAAEGDLDITSSGHTLTILGKGAGASIVNGNRIDRVFQVLGGANAAFSNMTIEGGLAQDNGSEGVLPGTTASEGGGVLIGGDAHVTFSQVYIQGNQAIGADGRNGTAANLNGAPGHAARGGGIFINDGSISLTGSRLTGNSATGGQGGAGFKIDCYPKPVFSCPGSPGAGAAGGAAAGGGLYVVSGSAGLSTSAVSSNEAVGGLGGQAGIKQWSTGTLATGFAAGAGGAAQGAGLFVEAGSLSLSQTKVSDNSGTGGGGGIHGRDTNGIPGRAASGGLSSGAGLFVASGKVSLANSTVFANTATGGFPGVDSINFTNFGPGGAAAGGGLYLSGGSVSLTGVTLASNQALGNSFDFANPPGSSHGGGIDNVGASLFINTTLIGNNSQGTTSGPGSVSNGDDVSGPITSTYSLIGQRVGATITDDGGNIFNVNPLLDPAGLGANGGPTQTVALEQGSPADGTGDNTICKEAPPTGLGGIDQRGFPRFRTGDELCDVGAFEFVTLLVQPFQPPSLSFGSAAVNHQTASQTVSVTNNQDRTVTLSRSIGGADPADFTVSTTCGGSLASHAKCSILIAFKPKVTGTRTATLTVSDSPDPTSPYHVTLTGIGG